MFQTFISRHNSNFFSDKLVLTSVTPASSAPVLQTPKATSSTLYFDSLTVNAGNGGFLHCIQMDTSVNAANQVVSVGADIAFDADPKFFACLVRFESSSVPTTLPTAYDVYPLDGRHDGGYYTVKDCVTIDVLPRTPGNNVYVGFMVWSNFTATKCRGLVSLNQVIKELIGPQPLKCGHLWLMITPTALGLLFLVAPWLNCLEAVKKPPADGQASWLFHMSNGNFVAVEQACTHAGVAVKYNASTGQFNCPAHGAIFNADGTNPQPPAPRPLPPVHITVNPNGPITTPQPFPVS